MAACTGLFALGGVRDGGCREPRLAPPHPAGASESCSTLEEPCPRQQGTDSPGHFPGALRTPKRPDGETKERGKVGTGEAVLAPGLRGGEPALNGRLLQGPPRNRKGALGGSTRTVRAQSVRTGQRSSGHCGSKIPWGPQGLFLIQLSSSFHFPGTAHPNGRTHSEV